MLSIALLFWVAVSGYIWLCHMRGVCSPILVTPLFQSANVPVNESQTEQADTQNSLYHTKGAELQQSTLDSATSQPERASLSALENIVFIQDNTQPEPSDLRPVQQFIDRNVLKMLRKSPNSFIELIGEYGVSESSVTSYSNLGIARAAWAARLLEGRGVAKERIFRSAVKIPDVPDQWYHVRFILHNSEGGSTHFFASVQDPIAIPFKPHAVTVVDSQALQHYIAKVFPFMAHEPRAVLYFVPVTLDAATAQIMIERLSQYVAEAGISVSAIRKIEQSSLIAKEGASVVKLSRLSEEFSSPYMLVQVLVD